MRRFLWSTAVLLLVTALAGATGAQAAAQDPQQAIPSSAQSPAGAGNFAGQDTCATCHADVAKKFGGNPHARIALEHASQGVTCESCHGPGKAHVDGEGDVTKIRRFATADQNAVCTQCHSETAGPFVYDHPVVKTEGCVSCHSVHGAPNARLLNVSNVNTLCLQCHSATNASAFPHAVSPAAPVHNQAAQYVACTSCHTQIHGSNESDIYFR